MKNSIILCMLFCSITFFAQNKIFQNTISENSLNQQQRLDPILASTYVITKYYSQNTFDLKSDLEIPLPSNRTIKVKHSKTFTYSNKSESSVYIVENEPKSELVLSKSGNAITGMYSSILGEKIIFHQLNNNLFAVSLVNEANLISRDSKNDFIQESSINQKVTFCRLIFCGEIKLKHNSFLSTVVLN